MRALLPEAGSNIKGNMRSYDQLLTVSGYGSRPNEFDELLRILNNQLRLISPIEQDGSDGDRQPRAQAGQKFFLLTHDYLVPSIREWLTRKQRETRRGRAELRLAERSAIWATKPETRQLPSLLEWSNIRLLTKSKDWTAGQRRMMRKAARVHRLRGLGMVVLVGTLVAAGSYVRNQVAESKQITKAEAFVAEVLTVKTDKVPGIVASMKRYRHWVDPALKEALRKAKKGSPEELHARLALLPVDAAQVEPLYDRMAEAEDPDIATVIGQSLERHRESVKSKLWTAVEQVTTGEKRILPAASALALYDPTNPRWAEASDKVALALVSVNPVFLGDWLDALFPVRHSLMAPLAAIFRDKDRLESEHSQSANILTMYASDDPDLIADLLMDADPKSYAAFFPIVQRQKSMTRPLFMAEIAKASNFSWNDHLLNTSSGTADPAGTARIESAQGILFERFAFCQTMPLDEFVTTAEGLRKSGYRPTRFRPYADGQVIRVAAVWTRDGRNWRISPGMTAEQVRHEDDRNKQDKFLPADVAGYVAVTSDGKRDDRYAAIWVEKAATEDDARMYVGEISEGHLAVTSELKANNLTPRTMQAMRGSDGRLRYCGIWGPSPVANPAGQWSVDQSQPGFERSQATRSDKTLTDVSVSGSEHAQPTRERAAVGLETAMTDLKGKPDDLKARLDRAIAHFRLGEYQQAIDDLSAVIEKKAPEAVIAYQYRAIAHARLRHKHDAKVDLGSFRKGDAAERKKLYLAVIVAAELGEGTDEAFEKLEADLKSRPQDIGLHYDASCAYALASQAVARKEEARSSSLSERALSLLRKAIENGYVDYKHMQEDADLDPIRDLPQFAEIMKPLHPDRCYAAIWANDLRFDASPILGLDPTAHLRRCRELAAQGYRMVAISVARTTPEAPSITASVWHRPTVQEDVKDRLAERQARAAIALVRMDKANEVWWLLRHRADPRLRSFIVNWLSPLGADPTLLATELDRIDPSAKPTAAHGQQKMDAILFHPETSQRRALILALGAYGTEGLSAAEREPLIGKLLDLYRNDPDSGIHGAAEWTLRKLGQHEKLEEIHVKLTKLKDWGDRRWFVNSLGQAFTVIDGPVEFRMGSPPTEPDHGSEEIQHRVVIRRRFAIAAKEVSVEQYQRFMKDSSTAQAHHISVTRHSLDPRGPMNGLTWYDAAAFCNWLSDQEGLPRDQWCYLPSNGKYTTGMTIPANVLRRTGYRLPTQAEWEYACRSGSLTSRYHGLSVGLLDGYAWSRVNGKDHAWTCGSLRPNDLGLFDTLGNVSEWVQDEHQPYNGGQAQAALDYRNHISHITESPRILRGGSFEKLPASVRSAYHAWDAPSFHFTSVGFRPARTYP